MPDLFDEAQEVEAMQREQALARSRWRGTAAYSLAECARCGHEIPEARRRLLPGVRTCVDCAAELEREVGLKGT